MVFKRKHIVESRNLIIAKYFVWKELGKENTLLLLLHLIYSLYLVL
jgi:hypothetical protein